MFQWIPRLPSALSHEPSEGDDETDHAVVDTESATTKESDDQEQPKANLTTGQRKKDSDETHAVSDEKSVSPMNDEESVDRCCTSTRRRLLNYENKLPS
jgi:hypothetical protein